MISWIGVRLTMRVTDFGRSDRRVVIVGTTSRGSGVDYESKRESCEMKEMILLSLHVLNSTLALKTKFSIKTVGKFPQITT